MNASRTYSSEQRHRGDNGVKLVMTLLVRNEADIIESNLDYHLAQGVDHVIVTDHGSTDATCELLRPYEKHGAVTVLREEGDEHHQSVRVTRMAQLALAEHTADWVFHNDADEFWWPLAGSLRDVFASIPAEYSQIEVQRHNFVARPDGPGPFYSRLIYRECDSRNLVGGPLEPKVAHRPHPDVVVAPGNHRISGAALRPIPDLGLLEIFHYPMRGYDQFEHKVVQIGIGYEKLDRRSPEVGRDQLTLLELYRADALREHYEGALLEDDMVVQGLASGKIVLDRRLEVFIDSYSDQPLRRERPDGHATRALVSTALRAFLDAETAQAELSRAEAQLAATSTELSRSRAEGSALADKLQASRTGIGSVANLLGAMGGRSLLRRSPRLHRLWQRIRRRS